MVFARSKQAILFHNFRAQNFQSFHHRTTRRFAAGDDDEEDDDEEHEAQQKDKMSSRSRGEKMLAVQANNETNLKQVGQVNELDYKRGKVAVFTSGVRVGAQQAGGTRRRRPVTTTMMS